jgi:hyperosmotically inducible periplasmic protein
MKKRFRYPLTAAAAVLTLAACSKQPEATAPMPAASAAVGNVSDIDVTEHVKTALQQNDLLKGFDINVVTLKGDVRLIGVLNNQAQINEAIKIARASDGAHSIHDELTLKK